MPRLVLWSLWYVYFISQKELGGKGPLEAICSSSPAPRGSPLASFPDLCWLLNSFKMESPKPPWATWSRAQSLSQYTWISWGIVKLSTSHGIGVDFCIKNCCSFRLLQLLHQYLWYTWKYFQWEGEKRNINIINFSSELSRTCVTGYPIILLLLAADGTMSVAQMWWKIDSNRISSFTYFRELSAFN